MTKRYIITLMAANRVGIIAAVTKALAELGGNLQEVSQTVMQKFFTIILAAEFPLDRGPQLIVDHLRDACRTFGVEVNLKDPELEGPGNEPPEGLEKYFLTVTGSDKPGIIREISARLARERIDITDLYAVRNENDASFVMVMELAVPQGVDALSLQEDLEQIGSTVGLSAALQHENIFAATNDPRPVKVALRLATAPPS